MKIKKKDKKTKREQNGKNNIHFLLKDRFYNVRGCVDRFLDALEDELRSKGIKYNIDELDIYDDEIKLEIFKYDINLFEIEQIANIHEYNCISKII